MWSGDGDGGRRWGSVRYIQRESVRYGQGPGLKLSWRKDEGNEYGVLFFNQKRINLIFFLNSFYTVGWRAESRRRLRRRSWGMENGWNGCKGFVSLFL